MKKIALIGPAHPLRGGLAAFNERLAIALQAAGYELTIYTFSLQYPDFLFPGKTQYSSDEAPESLIIEVLINSINPFNWLQAGRHIAKTQPDIVICAFWLPFMAASLGTICRIIRSKAGSTIVGLVHNIIPHEKRIGDNRLANYFVKSCDKFMVLSDAVADDLRQFDKQKAIGSSPHPIYDNYGKLTDKSSACEALQLDVNTPYILFFGLIRAYKGLDLLIAAMQDERIRALGIKLIVAGEFYTNEAAYQRQIDEAGVRDLLILHAYFIPNELVRFYFAAADLVVQPYKTATQSGISQIAYHFEKPMLVTNVGGLGEIVENGVAGYVVETEAKAIADAIVDFYEQKQAAMLTKGVQVAKKRYSWPIFVEQLERLIEMQ